MHLRNVMSVALIASCLALQPQTGNSCTRCVYLGPNDTVLVARSMDWVEDPSTEVYCFPRGMGRNGASGPNALTWTSKYGSVICSFFKVATVDGINEKGLVANTLVVAERHNMISPFQYCAWASLMPNDEPCYGSGTKRW